MWVLILVWLSSSPLHPCPWARVLPIKHSLYPNIQVNVKLVNSSYSSVFITWAFFVKNIFEVRSELGTSVLTDIVVSAVAVHVVPEVITEDRAGDISGLILCRFFGLNRMCCWEGEKTYKKGSRYSLRARQFSLWPKLFGSPSCQSNLKIEIGSLMPNPGLCFKLCG